MAEDWRVTVDLPDEAIVEAVLAALHEHAVGPSVGERLGGRVAVSSSGTRLFLYADTRVAADEAEHVLHGVLVHHGVDVEPTLDRWHPLEEAWEDAGVPLPRTPDERRAERERLEAEDARESQASGVAAWEVRVELASQRDAEQLAERLEADGLAVVRRSTFLLVGANNESEAHDLAGEIADIAPPGATVHPQPGGALAWQLWDHRPFAIFGGLAG
jgi:hypothetical protein